jgi:hypothetical protein
VKGKNMPIEILEVSHSSKTTKFEEIAGKYAEAFAEYRKGHFEKAERLFTWLAEVENDAPSLVLKRRCAELRVNPPVRWEGVFWLESK